MGGQRAPIEVARIGPHLSPRSQDLVVTLPKNLSIHNLLFISPGDVTLVFEPRHHLIERRPALAHPRLAELRADVAAGDVCAFERSQHEKLEMCKSW